MNPVMSLLRPCTLQHQEEIDDLQVAQGWRAWWPPPGAQLANFKQTTPHQRTSLAAGF